MVMFGPVLWHRGSKGLSAIGSVGNLQLAMATKCSRFIPGLFAFVSAKERRDDSLKPTALPA